MGAALKLEDTSSESLDTKIAVMIKDSNADDIVDLVRDNLYQIDVLKSDTMMALGLFVRENRTKMSGLNGLSLNIGGRVQSVLTFLSHYRG